MRVIALLATYNEGRFVSPCIGHLHEQGVATYLIDNESTDKTVEIAEGHRGRGLLGTETLPRDGGVFSLRRQLRRKEELARELEADWFIHLDADELRLPPPGQHTLAEALEAVDSQGYNAVNFMEFSFLPTREHPDHDHPEFERTLRTYYPFLPSARHRLNAWKAQADASLVESGGHDVRFPGLRLYPERFRMKHYAFLSVQHAVEKYVERGFDRDEVRFGWHGWRDDLSAEAIKLPPEADLRITSGDSDLDPSEPWQRHYLSAPSS
jgi:glycosyltransferase involved in cell wall biosynthesis